MRTRSTWTNGTETPRQAATQRHADIYTMNQEHPQPKATDYESGDPDSWAESPTTNKNVEQEYEGDHVKRNELGFGEFRDDTWKHKDSDKWNDGKGKYDNSKTAAERKASAAERVARAILRTANDELVREAAVDLMALPGQVLASTLRRMDQVSPDALPAHAKHRRAYACTKLAARLLGDAATEQNVERLATTFMTVDDPTLKSILSTVAAAQAEFNKRTAQQEEEQEEGKTSQQTVQAQEQEEEEQGKTSQQVQAQPQAQTSQQTVQAQQEEEQEEEGKTSQQQEQEEEQGHTSEEQQEAHGLTPQEMGMLDQMLQTEMAEGAAGGDADLMSIFTPPQAAAPMPAAPCPPAAPAMASEQPAAGGFDAASISFDDDDDDATNTNLASAAADLFADDPEVQAQRQIRAAHHEQVQRAAGYTGVGRTASAGGAKKVGKVQPAKLTPAQQLESLWDRP